MDFSNKLSCETGSFSHYCNPHRHRILQPEALRLYFPDAGTPGCMVCFGPLLFLPVYLPVNVGPLGLPPAASPTRSIALPHALSTPAEPTSLPYPHNPPRFCPCVLYNSSCNPLFPLSPPHSPRAQLLRGMLISCNHLRERRKEQGTLKAAEGNFNLEKTRLRMTATPTH